MKNDCKKLEEQWNKTHEGKNGNKTKSIRDQVPKGTTMRPKFCQDQKKRLRKKDCERKIVKERLWKKGCERKIVKQWMWKNDCGGKIVEQRL